MALLRILFGDGPFQEADMSVTGVFKHLKIGILELVPWLREHIGRIREATRTQQLFHRLVQDCERLLDGIVLRIYR